MPQGEPRTKERGAAPGMVRLHFLVGYNGADFAGWQSQKTGESVQDAIEKVFGELAGTPLRIHGAGRTDTGVHAIAQSFHADLPPGRFDFATWVRAMNAHLPAGVRILSVKQAPRLFHARFSSTGKVYQYRIWNDPVLHPLENGRAWHVPKPLDVGLLREVAAIIGGTHDFTNFAGNRKKPLENPVRTLKPVRMKKSVSLLTLEFDGSGFLYHMVRLLTGEMIRVAMGRQDLETFRTRLLNPDESSKASFCAPAEGLYLLRVRY